MKTIRRSLFLILLLTLTYGSNFAQPKEITDLTCGPILEGLRLCAASLRFSYKLPEEVVLELFIENRTKKDLQIQRGNFFKYLYEVKVLDQNRAKLPSFYEIAAEKQKNNTITNEESGRLLRLCCMGSMPSQQVIASKEKKKVVINLSELYDFKAKTSYTIWIERIEWVAGGNKKILIPMKKITIRVE